MALIVLRIIFVLIGIGASVTFFIDNRNLTTDADVWRTFGTVIPLAVAVIIVDVCIPKKRIDTISAVYFGLLVGVFLAYVLGLALRPFFPLAVEVGAIQLLLGWLLCYVCISVLLQTKDDFRFVIPYVEFAREIKGIKPYVLDTSVIIDGRIADVVETGVLDNQLVMPRFVLAELQNIADSSDKLRRSRGRRGLDILNRLRNHPDIDLTIHDRELPEMASQPVDMKLVLLARHLEGKLITGDYNLNKVAHLHSVTVINLNDLANAMRPVFLPGEQAEVKILKPGEEDGQGVGYLDDGTMIVVEGAKAHLQQMIRFEVTSVFQTSAGRMIFGKFQSLVGKDQPR